MRNWILSWPCLTDMHACNQVVLCFWLCVVMQPQCALSF